MELRKAIKSPGIGRLVAHLSQQTLQIVDGIQIFPDFIPGHRIAAEGLHGIQPFLHFIFMNQGLFQEASKASLAPWPSLSYQAPREGASLLFFPQAFPSAPDSVLWSCPEAYTC